MNHYRFTFFIALVWQVAAGAQDFAIDMQVVGSAGRHAFKQGQHWSYTIGQPVIATFNGLQHRFTQGFHQPEIRRTVSAGAPELAAWDISVFPNPTADRLQVKFSPPEGATGYLLGRIFDMRGRLTHDAMLLDAFGNVEIDCRMLSPGVYVLQVSAPDSRATTYIRFVVAAK
ncbi:MAG: T9SS type A sorting domain-containing protein [Saprospiraceae bacterium]